MITKSYKVFVDVNWWKVNQMQILHISWNSIFSSAGEPANFFAAPAPAPDFFSSGSWFFPKRLRLRLPVFFFEWLRLQGAKVQLKYNFLMLYIFSQGWGAGQILSGSGSWLFFQAAPAPGFFTSVSGSGSKEPKIPGSGSPALLDVH